jgi:hypothetical protein
MDVLGYKRAGSGVVANSGVNSPPSATDDSRLSSNIARLGNYMASTFAASGSDASATNLASNEATYQPVVTTPLI